MNREIQELKEQIKKYPNVHIYGAGLYGRKILKYLVQMGIEIKSMVVTNKEDNPERIGRYKVVTLDEIDTNPNETLFVLGVKDSVGEIAKVMLKSKGFLNWVNPPKRKADYDEVRFLPKLEITTQIGCSVNCRYCPQTLFCKKYSENSSIMSMSLETFKKCVDRMPQESVITFSGFCEPFLNEECVEMLQYAFESGMRIELYTTLVGLSVDKLKKIADINFETVVLHTPDDKEYAKIPMTKEYFEVLDYALEMVKKDGTPWIDSANCQGTPAPQFIEFVKGRLRVFSELNDRAGNLEEESEIKRADRLKGRIRCSRMNELNQWVLLPDGRVVLCCMDFGMQHVLGNLKDQTYQEITHGSELEKVKNGLWKEESSILCRGCTWAVCER